MKQVLSKFIWVSLILNSANTMAVWAGPNSATPAGLKQRLLETYSAKTIQRGFRDSEVRMTYHEAKAAKTIQQGFRDFKVRKVYQEKKSAALAIAEERSTPNHRPLVFDPSTVEKYATRFISTSSSKQSDFRNNYENDPREAIKQWILSLHRFASHRKSDLEVTTLSQSGQLNCGVYEVEFKSSQEKFIVKCTNNEEEINGLWRLQGTVLAHPSSSFDQMKISAEQAKKMPKIAEILASVKISHGKNLALLARAEGEPLDKFCQYPSQVIDKGRVWDESDDKRKAFVQTMLSAHKAVGVSMAAKQTPVGTWRHNDFHQNNVFFNPKTQAISWIDNDGLSYVESDDPSRLKMFVDVEAIFRPGLIRAVGSDYGVREWEERLVSEIKGKAGPVIGTDPSRFRDGKSVALNNEYYANLLRYKHANALREEKIKEIRADFIKRGGLDEAVLETASALESRLSNPQFKSQTGYLDFDLLFRSYLSYAQGYYNTVPENEKQLAAEMLSRFCRGSLGSLSRELLVGPLVSSGMFDRREVPRSFSEDAQKMILQTLPLAFQKCVNGDFSG